METDWHLPDSVGDELHACEDDCVYGQSKILAEEAIRNSSLTWSIFRLSSYFWSKITLCPVLCFGFLLTPAIEFTTPEDTGRAFVHAIHKRGARFKILTWVMSIHVAFRKFGISFEIFGLGISTFRLKAFAEKFPLWILCRWEII